MPFKHTVTDSRGVVHTRTSENRQYGFAVIVRFVAKATKTGEMIKNSDRVNWSRDERLARASAGQYKNSWGYDHYELIPCTPVPTGRHAAKADTRNADRIDGYDRDDLGESHD